MHMVLQSLLSEMDLANQVQILKKGVSVLLYMNTFVLPLAKGKL